MYQPNDRVFYMGVGVCEIEDIEQKTIVGETRDYYRLHSMDEQNRTDGGFKPASAVALPD